MNGKTIAIGLAAAFVAGAATAETELVVVSWGGAYSASQQKAYHEPYMAANPDIKILNDDSASEGLSKLRAMAEANNWSWDLVDAVAADAITACDEGIVHVIDHDAMLAPAPDGTSATEDFGSMIVSECFIPQIVYSTAFGYRTDLVKEAPTTIADVFDLDKIPGKRSLEKKPIGNLEWALIADGVPAGEVYDVLSTPEGVERAFAKLDTIKSEVVWWVKGAVPVQLLADGEVRDRIGLQRAPVLRHRGGEAADRHALGLAGVRHQRVGNPEGDHEVRRGGEAGAFRHGHAAPRRPGEVHPLRPGSDVVGAARRAARRSRDRHGAAYADRPQPRAEYAAVQLRVVGGPPRRAGRAVQRVASPGIGAGIPRIVT